MGRPPALRVRRGDPVDQPGVLEARLRDEPTAATVITAGWPTKPAKASPALDEHPGAQPKKNAQGGQTRS